MLPNINGRQVFGIDWSRGEVHVYGEVDKKGFVVMYSSLEEAAEKHPSSVFVFESSAESFQLQQRERVLSSFKEHNIEAWTFDTKYTARFRKDNNIVKSDAKDAKVIYRIATETPLTLHKFGPLVADDKIRDVINNGGGLDDRIGLIEDRYLFGGEITSKLAKDALKKVPAAEIEKFSELLFDSSKHIRKQVGRFLLIAQTVRASNRGFREYRRQIGNYGNGYGSMARSEFYKWLVQTTTNSRLNRPTLKGLSGLSEEERKTLKAVMKDADKFVKFLWRLNA